MGLCKINNMMSVHLQRCSSAFEGRYQGREALHGQKGEEKTQHDGVLLKIL